MRSIGLLGGSFNPAHSGHLHISREAKRRLRLDEVWWLVSPHNPLKGKETLADYRKRVQKAAEVARPARCIHISEFERKHNLRFTVDTLRQLKRRYPHMRFVWLMGADNLAQFHRWRRWREMARLTPIAVFDRYPFSHSSLRSPAAMGLARFRHPEKNPALLAKIQPVAWIFIHMRRNPLSATQLRKSLEKGGF